MEMNPTLELPQTLIDQLAQAIAKKLGVNNLPIEHVLWNTQDIAIYLRRSPTTVRDEITQLPSFPKPVRLPAPGKRSQALYKAIEIIKWAERHQSK